AQSHGTHRHAARKDVRVSDIVSAALRTVCASPVVKASVSRRRSFRGTFTVTPTNGFAGIRRSLRAHPNTVRAATSHMSETVLWLRSGVISLSFHSRASSCVIELALRSAKWDCRSRNTARQRVMVLPPGLLALIHA